MKKVRIFIAIITITASYSLTAQISITTDDTNPDGSAMLEVKSTDKGILMPRVALTGTTDETTISSPVVSLMIYNTATAQDVIPGFYYWNGAAWAPVSKTADGSETKVTGGTNVTVTGSGTTASAYVVNVRGAPNCSVGDFAHGGIVFWVDETGQHGLVCAKEDQTSINNYTEGIRWYGGFKGFTQAKGNGLYAGKANTAIIIAAQTIFDVERPAFVEHDGKTYAARICNELQISVGGKHYGDWYLPSRNELNLMYQNKATIDSTALVHEGIEFFHNNYWSSNEYKKGLAWCQVFGRSGGFQSASPKDNLCKVRAVRAF